ncbi:hypothetical protein JCGZ_25603 [Jatropha curcas]|uniref:Uncharacterized protein n=1 Tax=Jatropha curcas TaxID=180498 RepID=A0A067JKA3_JATCU|nr:protein SOB FIVE-LIKE 3 [Jatropha curcas]KDP24307.1 hypothetical protein JCGZ_25603 [Jatropha curcas]
MDSSKHHLGTEGCSSSESGWTMYIASPMEEDDNECSDHVVDDNDHNTIAIDGNFNDEGGDEQDSDDSMASDASSGPNHRYKYENGQTSRGTTSVKQDKGNNFNHCSPTKPNKKEKSYENSTEKNRRFPANRKYSK